MFSFLIGVVPASLPRQVVMRTWEACLGCLGDTAMAVTAVTGIVILGQVEGHDGGRPMQFQSTKPWRC